VIGGTDLWFAELNRDRPDPSTVDGLVYSVTPQVHTFDEESIAQSLEAQPDTVRTGMTFAAGMPLVVSPITLRPRDPIDAEMPNPAQAGRSLPFSVDPRQSSLFAAAWTVGSIGALSYAGAASLTYYETVGWRGIIPGDKALPESFVGAPPGGAFAVFHVLADVLELAEELTLLRCRSGRPSQVATVAFTAGDLVRVLAANLTPRPVTVVVDGFPARKYSVRSLDETTAVEALTDPARYRARKAVPVTSVDDGVSLDLAPFAVARLDVQLVN
jgi:D-apionolactonase